MTDFEFKFPRQVTPGSKAFLMCVPIQNNPYSNKKDKEAWDKGYRSAKRKYEADRYRQQKEAQQEAIEAGFTDKAPAKRPFRKPFSGQINTNFRTVS